MTSHQYHITLAEIDRDHRMLVLALLRHLTAISTDQLTQALAGGRLEDPLDLCQRIESLVTTSRAHYRRLNDARINRRGRAPRPLTDSGAPPALRPFTRNGAYGGCYDDLGSLARAVLPTGAVPPELERYVDFDALGLDLHLDGALWTLDHHGKIHIFRETRDPAGPHRSTRERPAEQPSPTRPAQKRKRRHSSRKR